MRLRLTLLVGVVAIGVLPSAARVPPGAVARPRASPRDLGGWALYDRFCLACHGERGDGRGPAAPFTTGQPHDLTSGTYKWRTTLHGRSATDDDLRRTIRYGAPGTSMPGFALDTPSVDALVEVVRAFAPPPPPGPAAGIVTLGPPPPLAPERGAAVWTQRCATCHGDRGTGDGLAASHLARAPYDLRRIDVHRPRPSDRPDDRRAAIAWSIATGISGTPMTGYAGTLPDADLWALADHVLSLRAATRANIDRSVLDDDAIDADRATTTTIGRWPASGDDAIVFGTEVPAQGVPPASLAPAQASLSAQQCARCHAKQFREWTGSVHARAVSPGLVSQIDHTLPSDEAESCQRCHSPLAEQRTDAALRAEGITCAGCHVRGWTRHGPAALSPSLLATPGYPTRALAIYERADLCLACHQLPPRTAVAGKPLLNTYKEWLEGPYMRRGVQCQHCHMPNREHTFLGVHDPATFRQGYTLSASAHRDAGTVTVRVTLANSGAGHHLPTTPTPAAWLRLELLDAAGVPIAGARAEHRIGRDLQYDGTWTERADTRIPPGEAIVVARAWRAGRTGDALHARVTLEVHPDAYYEYLYATRLRGHQAPDARRLTEDALRRARATHYVAEQRLIPIAQ